MDRKVFVGAYIRFMRSKIREFLGVRLLHHMSPQMAAAYAAALQVRTFVTLRP
jgi:hypothetical protein